MGGWNRGLVNIDDQSNSFKNCYIYGDDKMFLEKRGGEWCFCNRPV